MNHVGDWHPPTTTKDGVELNGKGKPRYPCSCGRPGCSYDWLWGNEGHEENDRGPVTHLALAVCVIDHGVQDTFRDDAISVGIKRLFDDPHFSRCTFDAIAALAGVRPDQELNAVMGAVHCVKWADMPGRFRSQLQHRITGLFPRLT